MVPSYCTLTVTCEGVTGPTAADTPANVACPANPFSGSLVDNFDNADYDLIPPGDYVYTFKVSTGGADASLNPTFEVTQVLVDPCLTPTITAPTVTGPIEYTITDDQKTIVPSGQFTVSPAYCPVNFVFESNLDFDASTGLTFDETDQDFTLPNWSADLDTLDSDGTPKTYTNKVTYNVYSKYLDAGATVTGTDNVEFDIEVKNPCIDTNFVNIVGPSPLFADDLDYIVYDEPEIYPAHGEFTVAFTKTVTNADLCGAVQLEAFFDTGASGANSAVPATIEAGLPIAYDPDTRVFTADSEDISLIDTNSGIYPIQVKATLADYQPDSAAVDNTGVTTSTKNGAIDFNDPCIDPFEFTSSEATQTSPAANTYDGVTITVPISVYKIEPSLCNIAYSCKSVTRIDGAASGIGCADFTVDGDTSGDADDLTFKITADSTKYMTASATPGSWPPG